MIPISDADESKIFREQIESPPKGETSLHAFMRLAWHLVDPNPFTDGWHLHAKCDVLTEVHEGRLKDLILNEPPGSCKSMLVNVFWPAYIWLKVNKSARLLFGSFDQTLVNRDAQHFVNLLKSPLIRGAFPEFSLGGENEKKAVEGFTNDHFGLRFGTTPGGRGTGWHFHGHIYDDLIKPASIIDGVSAEAQKSLAKAINWIRETMSNRAIDQGKLWRVLIAQRLHEADPSGQLLAEASGWEHLCFPEEYVKNATWIIGGLTAKHDPRTQDGELLWPERRDAEAVRLNKKRLKKQAAIDAQNQQNPTAASGGILRYSDFEKHGYKTLPDLRFSQIVASLDLAFEKGEVESSRCAGSLWAKLESGRCVLLDGWAAQMDYVEARQKVKDLLVDPLWGSAQVFLVEKKANGHALLSEKLSPKVIEFEPSGANKAERMLPFILPTRTGMVQTPCPETFPQHKEHLQEVSKFPRAANDDYWDTWSQALLYLATGAQSATQALAAYLQEG